MQHTRHMHIFQIPSGFSVTLIGAGGIGAAVALALAKIGVRTLQVFDDDTVSDENLATQLHEVSENGNFKVDALQRMLEKFSDDIYVMPRPFRVDALSELCSSLVISAVDNIAARHAIWDALNNSASNWDWYLDCRMGAENFDAFLVPREPLQMTRYWNLLSKLNDDNVADLPCTAKSTFYCALMSAGHVGSIVRDIVRGEVHPMRLVHNIPGHFLQTFAL